MENDAVRFGLHLRHLCVFFLLSQAHALAQDSQPIASQPASQPKPANLLFNGDFETPDESGKLPAGWTTKHPDHVRLVDLGGWHGRVIEMTGGKKLMASYGVDLTSEKIPVKPNTRYRCTGYTRSTKPHMKVFIKGYATVTRRIDGELKTFDDIVYQMRKDIEPSDDWQPFNLDFEIAPAKVFSDFQHEVEYVRIRLWAFWPAGTCWFDDIRFEEVGPVPEVERRHDKGVTHVGLPPRLGEHARQPEAEAAADVPAGRPSEDVRFDEDQTWRDAVNAFRANDHEQAARLARALITHVPNKGAYRVLAARAAAQLKRWDKAEQHARWLLNETESTPDKKTPPPQIESWQRDWAHIVQAEVCWHTDRIKEAHAILKELLKGDPSPHARAAAEKLLAEMQSTKEED